MQFNDITNEFKDKGKVTGPKKRALSKPQINNVVGKKNIDAKEQNTNLQSSVPKPVERQHIQEPHKTQTPVAKPVINKNVSSTPVNNRTHTGAKPDSVKTHSGAKPANNVPKTAIANKKTEKSDTPLIKTPVKPSANSQQKTERTINQSAVRQSTSDKKTVQTVNRPPRIPEVKKTAASSPKMSLEKQDTKHKTEIPVENEQHTFNELDQGTPPTDKTNIAIEPIVDSREMTDNIDISETVEDASNNEDEFDLFGERNTEEYFDEPESEPEHDEPEQPTNVNNTVRNNPAKKVVIKKKKKKTNIAPNIKKVDEEEIKQGAFAKSRSDTLEHPDMEFDFNKDGFYDDTRSSEPPKADRMTPQMKRKIAMFVFFFILIIVFIIFYFQPSRMSFLGGV